MFFLPSDKQYQVMLNTEDPVISILPGQSVTLTVPSVCASTKTIKPPPPLGVQYRIGSHPDPGAVPALIRIVQTAQELDRLGRFAMVPVAPELRARKIAQTAIWKYLGDLSRNKADRITTTSLREDLAQGLGKLASGLSLRQQEKLDTFAAELYKAVETTLKEAGVTASR